MNSLECIQEDYVVYTRSYGKYNTIKSSVVVMYPLLVLLYVVS